jgi:hypothetical protein
LVTCVGGHSAVARAERLSFTRPFAKVPIRFAGMNFKRADTIPVARQAEDGRAFTPER